MSQLEQIISNLKSKPEIDAVFVTGSQGIGEEKSYSDIDLGVVVNKGTDLKSLFQWVDDKPCDIHFFETFYLEMVLKGASIPPNDKEGLIVSFLEKADIKFDKTGLLTSFKNDIENLNKKLQVPPVKMKWFEGIINAAYIVNKRYYDSGLTEYLEALEVKLMLDLHILLMGYFEFRNIPWKGEKHVLKYLKSNDSKFYNLYMTCIKSSSLKEKFEDYETLVKLVFQGEYGLWTKDTVRVFSKQPLTIDGEKVLVDYWEGLIS